MRLRRCAATPHPPPSGAPSPQGEGLRVRHSHREPLKRKANGGVSFNTADPSRGKANGGVSFNTADPSRGRLTEARHSTPRPIKGEGLEAAAGAENFCRGWGKRPRQPPRR